jgi:hypothetical protein
MSSMSAGEIGRNAACVGAFSTAATTADDDEPAATLDDDDTAAAAPDPIRMLPRVDDKDNEANGVGELELFERMLLVVLATACDGDDRGERARSSSPKNTFDCAQN